MEPYKIGQGEYIKADDTTRIGQGGFGTVFYGKWHDQESAFKYLSIRNESSGQYLYVKDLVNGYIKRITEYRKQLDISMNQNSGVIIPNAFYRQQLQIKKDDGTFVAENYDVFVYPRYDCNLRELHQNHFDNFDKEITLNILKQCFTR